MSDCDQGGCLLNLGAIPQPTLSNPEAVLRDVSQPRTLRATALDQLVNSRSSSVADVLRYNQVLLFDPDEGLRQFARIGLYFWLLWRGPLPISAEAEEIIRRASSFEYIDGMERLWLKMLRAILTDPGIVEESRLLIAEGKAIQAVKLLTLMRTKESLDIVREDIWDRNEPTGVSLKAAIVLGASGDPIVREYLTNSINTQQRPLDEKDRIRAIVALAAMGEEAQIEQVRGLLATGALRPTDGILMFATRGFAIDFPTAEGRVKAWLDEIEKRSSP